MCACSMAVNASWQMSSPASMRGEDRQAQLFSASVVPLGAPGGQVGSSESESSTSVIYAHVRRGTVAMLTLVDDWIDRYKQDRDAALIELLQVLLLIPSSSLHPTFSTRQHYYSTFANIYFFLRVFFSSFLNFSMDCAISPDDG